MFKKPWKHVVHEKQSHRNEPCNKCANWNSVGSTCRLGVSRWLDVTNESWRNITDSRRSGNNDCCIYGNRYVWCNGPYGCYFMATSTYLRCCTHWKNYQGHWSIWIIVNRFEHNSIWLVWRDIDPKSDIPADRTWFIRWSADFTDQARPPFAP